MKNTLNSIHLALEQFFGISEMPRELEGGLSHEVYSLDEAKLIVKVYSTEISNERLETEQEALEILAESKQINAPKFIRSKRGNFREPVNGSTLSCYQRIDGERKFLLTEAPNDLRQIADMGSYLGILHRELAAGSGGLTPKTSPIFEVARTLVSSPREIDQIVDELISNQAPYLICHGDFQQSNLLYLGDTISGIIDFEYSTPDFRIIDVAGCLSNLLSANSNHKETDELIRTFLKFYEESSGLPLTAVERSLFKSILKMIWKVNLYWVDSKLKIVRSAKHGGLLELYKRQTIACFRN